MKDDTTWMIEMVFRRVLLPLALPVGLLLAAWLVLPLHELLPDSLKGLMRYGPYGTLLVAALLGVTVNRGKLVLTVVLLCGGLYLLDIRKGSPWVTMEQASLIDLTLQGLIPLNVVIVSCYRERGVFTSHQLLRLGILALQAVLLYFIYFYPDAMSEVVSQQTRMRIMNGTYLRFFYEAYIPLLRLPYTHLVQIMLVLGSVVLFPAVFYHKDHLSFGILGAFLGYTMGVLFTGVEHLLAVNTVAASLLLCVALLRDSFEMAYRDELTGLPQRRALNERMMALGPKYTLAMLDVDHFKQFNDTHGHDVGDQVLQMVAGRIARVGGGGKAFRYGGEEFSIVFPGKSIEYSLPWLETVRESVEKYAMIIRDDARPEISGKETLNQRVRGSFRKATKTVSVTISIGLASRADRSERPEDVLKKADDALYRAKKSGRNRISQ